VVTASIDGTARVWVGSAEEVLRVAEGRLARLGITVEVDP